MSPLTTLMFSSSARGCRMHGRASDVTKALIVDDNEVQLDVWQLQLQQLGIAVLRPQNYDDALALANAERPQVAIIDMVLEAWGENERSGLTLIRDLHAQDTGMYKHLASSWAGIRSTLIASKWGCSDASCKPIDARSVVMAASGDLPDPERDRFATLEDVERAHIERALHEFRGNITHAATALGIYPFALRRKIDRLRIRSVGKDHTGRKRPRASLSTRTRAS